MSKSSAQPASVVEVLAALESAADPTTRAELSTRYGIHSPKAMGVSMATMKAIAKPLARDHALALALWSTGWYEARTVAALIDDPTRVTALQMDEWCADFDSWAIVDTVCFNLFDRSAHAWDKVDQWAADDREFVRRAAFALLWSLALHRKDTTDDHFLARLPLVETYADDDRHLVAKAIVMAVRAIATQRPSLHGDITALADRLDAAPTRAARTIGRGVRRLVDQAHS